jgi:hypothetical protein
VKEFMRVDARLEELPDSTHKENICRNIVEKLLPVIAFLTEKSSKQWRAAAKGEVFTGASECLKVLNSTFLKMDAEMAVRPKESGANLPYM